MPFLEHIQSMTDTNACEPDSPTCHIRTLQWLLRLRFVLALALHVRRLTCRHTVVTAVSLARMNIATARKKSPMFSDLSGKSNLRGSIY